MGFAPVEGAVDDDDVVGLDVGESVDETREVVVDGGVGARLERDAVDVNGFRGRREVDVPAVAGDGADVASDVEGPDLEGVTTGHQSGVDGGTGRRRELAAVETDLDMVDARGESVGDGILGEVDEASRSVVALRRRFRGESDDWRRGVDGPGIRRRRLADVAGVVDGADLECVRAVAQSREGVRAGRGLECSAIDADFEMIHAAGDAAAERVGAAEDEGRRRAVRQRRRTGSDGRGRRRDVLNDKQEGLHRFGADAVACEQRQREASEHRRRAAENAAGAECDSARQCADFRERRRRRGDPDRGEAARHARAERDRVCASDCRRIVHDEGERLGRRRADAVAGKDRERIRTSRSGHAAEDA